jgi:hypothetical protein
MTYDDDKREVARRAAEMLRYGLDELETAAREVERETGEKVLHRRPALADATRPDLELLVVQAEAGAAALRVALQWVGGGGETLGGVIKTLPRHISFELTMKLRAAGLDV